MSSISLAPHRFVRGAVCGCKRALTFVRFQRQPDLRKELDWFSRDPFNPGKHMTVETLVDFRPLTRPADGGPPQVDLGDGVIIRMTGLPEDSDSLDTEVVYEFLHNGSPLAQVPDTISLPDLTPPKTMYRPFQPPTFGVTFLGTSHGFDPNGQTVCGSLQPPLGVPWCPLTRCGALDCRRAL